MAGLLSMFVVLVLRVVYLHTRAQAELQAQGDSRYLREVVILPQRGRILDRNGRVLSVSTPVYSLAAEPAVFCRAAAKWPPMLTKLKRTAPQLHTSCQQYQQADFMYIQRQLPPATAEQVMAMNIPGLEMRREFKRYYPHGSVGAHLLGFTDIDERGLEGLELQYDRQLKGNIGRARVLKGRTGQYVENVESIQPVQHGKDLMLSIDQRLQSLASRYLDDAIRRHRARAGNIVVIAIPSGEILAMVNAPQFNPNARESLQSDTFRNRVVTDILEPGSTIKPFTVARALDHGLVTAKTLIDTSPGHYTVAGQRIQDLQNYGTLSVFDIIVHSSNVGAAKLALSLPFSVLFDTFKQVGFGQLAAALPGEITGVLKPRRNKLDHAVMAYGYGLATTVLQLARAYTTFATDGRVLPLTLAKKPPGYAARGARVFSAASVAQIRLMLEQAASPRGTGGKARVARYRIGGKTGTTQKLVGGQYDNNHHIAIFAGLAPITDPKFVMVVTIDDPRGDFYYGGDVAAPIFAKLMADLLRLYNIRPDALASAPRSQTTRIASYGARLGRL